MLLGVSWTYFVPAGAVVFIFLGLLVYQLVIKPWRQKRKRDSESWEDTLNRRSTPDNKPAYSQCSAGGNDDATEDDSSSPKPPNPPPAILIPGDKDGDGQLSHDEAVALMSGDDATEDPGKDIDPPDPSDLSQTVFVSPPEPPEPAEEDPLGLGRELVDPRRHVQVLDPPEPRTNMEPVFNSPDDEDEDELHAPPPRPPQRETRNRGGDHMHARKEPESGDKRNWLSIAVPLAALLAGLLLGYWFFSSSETTNPNSAPATTEKAQPVPEGLHPISEMVKQLDDHGPDALATQVTEGNTKTALSAMYWFGMSKKFKPSSAQCEQIHQFSKALTSRVVTDKDGDLSTATKRDMMSYASGLMLASSCSAQWTKDACSPTDLCPAYVLASQSFFNNPWKVILPMECKEGEKQFGDTCISVSGKAGADCLANTCDKSNGLQCVDGKCAALAKAAPEAPPEEKPKAPECAEGEMRLEFDGKCHPADQGPGEECAADAQCIGGMKCFGDTCACPDELIFDNEKSACVKKTEDKPEETAPTKLECADDQVEHEGKCVPMTIKIGEPPLFPEQCPDGEGVTETDGKCACDTGYEPAKDMTSCVKKTEEEPAKAAPAKKPGKAKGKFCYSGKECQSGKCKHNKCK